MDLKELDKTMDNALFTLSKTSDLLDVSDHALQDIKNARVDVENAPSNEDKQIALNFLLCAIDKNINQLETINYFAKKAIDENIESIDTFTDGIQY